MGEKEPELHGAGTNLFPRKGANGSSSGRVFSVEVRYDYSTPQAHGDFIIDREWRTLPVSISPFGVGVPDRTWVKNAASHGLMSWPTANALRWWAHAAFGLCLQSRLVEHAIVENYTITVLGFHDVIGGGGNGDRERAVSCPLGDARIDVVPLTL